MTKTFAEKRLAQQRKLASASSTDLRVQEIRDRRTVNEAAAERSAQRSDVQTTAAAAAKPVQVVKGAASRRDYIAALTVTALVIAVQTFRSKTLSAGERRSAVVSMVILFIAIAAVGEFSPEIATGFSVLLLVSVLIGGTNAAHYLFIQLPGTLAGKKVTS